MYATATEAASGLADRLDLTVAVCAWGTHGPTVVHIQEFFHHIHVNVRPGTVFGLTTTATGKLFSALMPEGLILPQLEAELAAPGGKGKPTLAQLRTEFEAIRRTGLSTIRNRPIPGVSALSAPVFDHSDQMQAAIMVMGPSSVVDCHPTGKQARMLLAVTRGISKRLGHRSTDLSGSDDGERMASSMSSRQYCEGRAGAKPPSRLDIQRLTARFEASRQIHRWDHLDAFPHRRARR